MQTTLGHAASLGGHGANPVVTATGPACMGQTDNRHDLLWEELHGIPGGPPGKLFPRTWSLHVGRAPPSGQMVPSDRLCKPLTTWVL